MASPNPRTTKRVFDIFCALFFLLLALPLFLLIGIAVWMTSRGPIIFKQKRLGYLGAVFTIFKFRTLKAGTGRRLDMVTKGDPRVTRVGRFLRATHLDELPQLINVLLGDMSIVGPRPDEISIAEDLKARIPGYAERLDMMPGITGPQQLRGREEIIRCGRECEVPLLRLYRDGQSLFRDCEIIGRTVLHVLRGQGI